MGALKEMFLSLLKDSSLVVMTIVGVIVIFGFILGAIETMARKNIARSIGYWGMIITAPGVIVHELSHYIGCKIFRFDVQEVKLFRPFKAKLDGCLGYVSYSYQKNNIIHRIGKFFVGTGPIVGGSITILLLLWLLLPEVFNVLGSDMKTLITEASSLTIKDVVILQIDTFKSLIQLLFTSENISSIQFWIFIYLGFSISSHIGLSGPDLEGSFSGLVSIFMATISVGFILSLFSLNIVKYLGYLHIYNTILIAILSIAVGFALIHLAISYLFKILIAR